MKMDIFYRKLFFGILIVCWGVSLNAQETVTKKVEKSARFSSSGTMQINNTYGDITINGWNKDFIDITVAIEVTNKKKDKAQELLNRIKAEFKINESLALITTVIEEKSVGFFAKYFNKVNPFDEDMSDVKIDYTITLPYQSEIALTNRFGDVIFTGWTGKLKANLEHGDMWINDAISRAHITSKFGQIKTKNLSYGSISVENGELQVEEAHQLYISSSGSTIFLEKVQVLDITSSKDKIDINTVGNLQGSINFSNVKVNSLLEELGVTAKVADVKIEHIEKENPKLFIEQESSEFNINISGVSFAFNALLEEGVLRIPKTFKDISSDIINNSKKIRKIKATYGNGAKGDFSIKGDKGIIILKE